MDSMRQPILRAAYRLAPGRFHRRGFGPVKSMLLGSVCVYVPGLVWFHHQVPDWSYVIHWGLTVFIIGDLIKIAGAAAVLDPRAPWGGLFDRIRLP